MARDRSAVPRVAGELLLIFVGVLLALAADDWREKRDQAARGRAVLRAIEADLPAERALLQRLAESYAQDAESAAALLANAGNAEFSIDSVATAVAAFYLGSEYAPSDASFTTAVQTGSLGFIENESLRVSLVDYFDQSGSVFQANFQELLLEVSALHDLLNQYLRPDVTAGDSLWPAPPQPRQLDAPWDALRGDNELMMQVLDFGIYAAYLVDFARRRAASDEQLEQSIRIEVDRTES